MVSGDSEVEILASTSYASGTSQLPLLGETIGQNLRRTASRWPAADALVDLVQGVRYTYEEFDAAVDNLARALLGAGMAKGDRVAVWAPNCSEWVLLQYATARAGVILVNINPAYRTYELQYALNQSGSRMLFAVPTFKTSDYRTMIDSVRDELPQLERVVFLGTEDWVALLGEGADEAALHQRAAELSFDDPINIQYTSGTTGSPKGATLTHHNILNNGFFIGEGCRYTQDDRVCIPVPFYHCFGMVLGNLACTTHGATIVIPSPSFEPAAALRAVSEERCTSLLGVPTMFIAELALPDFANYDLSSLRTGIMAGSPCPTEVMRRCINDMHMTEVTICYGMTETSPVSTQTAADDPLDKRVGTVGRVHPHVEVKIIDVTGRLVARGEKGELCTRGYSVMLGYWTEPTMTAHAIDETGWMHTGDLATMDEDGYVDIGGRIKDLIIRGGENVYPREIEEFLYRHPDIIDVQVIGVPDARYGEEIMAWVVVREGAVMDSDVLRDFCREKIAHHKIPRYVNVVTEFPMTITGKVRKVVMREQSIVLLGLEDEGAGPTAQG
jgi:fatty-acyl-CoA synthase